MTGWASRLTSRYQTPERFRGRSSCTLASGKRSRSLLSKDTMGSTFDFAIGHNSSSVSFKLDSFAIRASLREYHGAADVTNFDGAVVANVRVVPPVAIPDQIVSSANLASGIFPWWIHPSVRLPIL